MAKDPRNSVNILNHSVKVIGGGVGKDKEIIGQNMIRIMNTLLIKFCITISRTELSTMHQIQLEETYVICAANSQ